MPMPRLNLHDILQLSFSILPRPTQMRATSPSSGTCRGRMSWPCVSQSTAPPQTTVHNSEAVRSLALGIELAIQPPIFEIYSVPECVLPKCDMLVMRMKAWLARVSPTAYCVVRLWRAVARPRPISSSLCYSLLY